jgi:hypothetical protein
LTVAPVLSTLRPLWLRLRKWRFGLRQVGLRQLCVWGCCVWGCCGWGCCGCFGGCDCGGWWLRRLRRLGLRQSNQLLLFGRKQLVEDLPLLELRLVEDLPLLLQLRLESLRMVLKQQLHRPNEERALLHQLLRCDRGESMSQLRLL